MPAKDPATRKEQTLKDSRNRREMLDEMARHLGEDSHYKMLTVLLTAYKKDLSAQEENPEEAYFAGTNELFHALKRYMHRA